MKKQNKKEQCENIGVGGMFGLIIGRIYSVCTGKKNNKNTRRENVIICIIFLVPAFVYCIVNIFSLEYGDVINLTVISGIVVVMIAGRLLRTVIERNKLSITETLLRVSAITFFMVTSAFFIFAINAHFIHLFGMGVSKEADLIKNIEVSTSVKSADVEKLNNTGSYTVESDEAFISASVLDAESKNSNSVTLVNDEELLALIALLGTFAGFLAYIFKEIVRRDIKDMVKKDNDKIRVVTEREYKKLRCYIKGVLYKNEGVDLYMKYKNSINSKGIENLNKALNRMTKALGVIKELCMMSNADDEEVHINKEYNRLLCVIRNNIAWMILKQGDKNRALEAQQHIEFVIKDLDKYDSETTKEWVDTYEKVNDWAKNLKQ